ncbi:MAG: phospho-N-acetylmuramoyl-pentapeptide-transferase, partial [Acidobacteria bacterium]|nr:phospho-N-acetylmuramoyl-pentapeptide-transferase [Acidobacteriota bacterium]
MLYYLFYEVLFDYFSPFRVFRYLTFRTAFASITALLICLVLGPWLIARLREFQIGQYIREDGPQHHHAKAGTPTMGGVLINVAILVPTLLWANLRNPFVWLVMLVTLSFGVVGFLDDYFKVRRRNNKGLSGRGKLYSQILISFLTGVALLFLTVSGYYSTHLIVPFFKEFTPDLLIHSFLDHPYTYPLAFAFFFLFVVLV